MQGVTQRQQTSQTHEPNGPSYQPGQQDDRGDGSSSGKIVFIGRFAARRRTVALAGPEKWVRTALFLH